MSVSLSLAVGAGVSAVLVGSSLLGYRGVVVRFADITHMISHTTENTYLCVDEDGDETNVPFTSKQDDTHSLPISCTHLSGLLQGL